MTTWAQYAAKPTSEKIYLAELELARDDGEGGIETMTLYLSTKGLDPALTDKFYAPRIKGVPAFSRRIQELFYGKTQSAFGVLDILIGDGGLDGYLTGWNWTGREVVLKLGFEGQDKDDFEVIFTGRMGLSSLTDAVLSLPILDFQEDCLVKKHAAYTNTDTLAKLVEAALGHAGISAPTTSAIWIAWAAENNFQCYLDTDGTEAVSTILDRLLAPLACWWGFNRAGEFIIGTFKAPTEDSGDAALILADDIEVLDFRQEDLDRYWSVTIQYYNVPPATAEVTESDSDIEDLNPLALEGGAKETALTAVGDANTVLARWWALLSAQRRVLTVTAKAQPLALKLHDQVRLTRDRFSFDENMRVIGFSENYSNSRTEMELWA